MATTFDGDNLVITLNAGGSVHTVDAQADLYSDWKEWLKTSSAQYEPAFRVVGGDPLTPGINAGSYFFVRNDLGWRIRPAEEDATIFMVGNLTPEDSTLPILIPTIGNFSVLVDGLQPITQSVATILTLSQNADYQGRVAIDTVNGVSGTTYPVGTPRNPVNNLADATTIATTLGITSFTVRGSITLTQAYDDWIFAGLGPEPQNAVALNGQSVSGSIFEQCNVSGAGTGAMEAIRSRLFSLSGVTGIFRSCGLADGLTLGAGFSMLDHCFSGVPGATKPTLDLNSLNSQVNVRHYSGGLELRNVAHASTKISIDMTSGRLLLAASNTLGEIVVGSPGAELVDSSAGATVDKESFVEAPDVRRTRKRLINREYVNPTTNKIEQWNDAGTSIEYSADIWEDDGTTPWDGTGPIRRRDDMV